MTTNRYGSYTRHESPDYADGGVTAALIEKEAEEYTDADFANAEFARNPDGRVAARANDHQYPWATRDQGFRAVNFSDADMAGDGWSPVRECPDPEQHGTETHPGGLSASEWKILAETYGRALDAGQSRSDQAEWNYTAALNTADRLRDERDEVAEALDTTLGRAIKAEKERDEERARTDAADDRPLAPVDITLHSANSADWVRVRVEHPAFGVIEEGIPLPARSVPNVFTDAMIDRARKALRELHEDGDLIDGSVVAHQRVAYAVLDAALTKPQRPEGAEEVEALIDRAGAEGEGADNESLADYLTRCGVRVVGEEGP